MVHSDPQIRHRNPPLSPAPRPSSIAAQYRDEPARALLNAAQPQSSPRSHPTHRARPPAPWVWAGACYWHGVGEVMHGGISLCFHAGQPAWETHLFLGGVELVFRGNDKIGVNAAFVAFLPVLRSKTGKTQPNQA